MVVLIFWCSEGRLRLKHAGCAFGRAISLSPPPITVIKKRDNGFGVMKRNEASNTV